MLYRKVMFIHFNNNYSHESTVGDDLSMAAKKSSVGDRRMAVLVSGHVLRTAKLWGCNSLSL